MRWTVVFTDEADNDLAMIYLDSLDKGLVTYSSSRIEQELRNDPDSKGEEFYGDRLLQYGNLAVAYELCPDDLLVRVIHVMPIRERN